MDTVKVAVVGSPFANLFPIYDVAGDEADVLLIVPSSTKPFAPWDEPVPNPYRPATAAIKSSSGLRIKASSKHLILASRVLKNKLHHASAKTSTQSDGRIHLTLAEGFDPKAASIVLNAIHSRGSKVPRAIDLETLAKIALFVDRFQLYDAVEIYADRWITKLEDQLADAFDRDLVFWIYVSYVFRRSDLFQSATKAAVAQSNGPLRTLGLPIREKIIREIDLQRQSLVSTSLTSLHAALDTLATTTPSCPKYHCDSFLLGELIKTLTKARLFWPRPEKPFAGISHTAIVDAVISTAQFQWRSPEVVTAGGGADLWGNPIGKEPPKRTTIQPHQQITPESSPEPVARVVSSFETHACEARRLVAGLEGLEDLAEGVQGLRLESGLGYQLY
ncbi:hypothetical protein QBC39DRAFT_301251 [Podospora conica]|nr:hypothetical protein QBC39DRAFT_301251 [Schizothecium conicum]